MADIVERLKVVDDWGWAALSSLHSDAAAEIQRLREENERLRHLQEFAYRWTWREDPPNSNHKLTDTERLSAIKWHPMVKVLRAKESVE